MRLTYIASDRLIRIDEEFRRIPESIVPQIDSNISAIQWYEDKGEIEYKDKELNPNKKMDENDLNLLSILQDIWVNSIKEKEIDSSEKVYYDAETYLNPKIFEFNMNFDNPADNLNI